MKEKIELSRDEAYFVAGILNNVKYNRINGLSEEENTDLFYQITKLFDNIIKQLDDKFNQ